MPSHCYRHRTTP
uniref:Uncharacterized protein n=1 Tax=Arundo donax TaxID=35708 RepID=A0A0A8ZLA6_ARUDO